MRETTLSLVLFHLLPLSLLVYLSRVPPSAGMSQLRELMAAFTAWGVMTESMVTGAVGRRVESAGRVDPLVDTAVRHSRRHSKRITLTVKLGGCVLSTTLYDYKRK